MFYLEPDKKFVKVKVIRFFLSLILPLALMICWRDIIVTICVLLVYVFLIRRVCALKNLIDREWVEFFDNVIIVRSALCVKNIVYIKDIVSIEEKKLRYDQIIGQDFYIFIDDRPKANRFGHVSAFNNKHYCVKVYKNDFSTEMVNKIKNNMIKN